MLMCSSCAEIWDYTTIVDLEKKGKGDKEQRTCAFSRLGVYNIMYNASTISCWTTSDSQAIKYVLSDEHTTGIRPDRHSLAATSLTKRTVEL